MKSLLNDVECTAVYSYYRMIYTILVLESFAGFCKVVHDPLLPPQVKPQLVRRVPPDVIHSIHSLYWILVGGRARGLFFLALLFQQNSKRSIKHPS